MPDQVPVGMGGAGSAGISLVHDLFRKPLPTFRDHAHGIARKAGSINPPRLKRIVMSTIFGVLRFDSGVGSDHDLKRMSRALAHRGPDGTKFIVNGPVALGHGLMRVNREDAFEAQPLCDRNTDIILVADLRLDNREELSSALGLAPTELHDTPDSALLLRAYKQWGEDCGQHLLGDFAFAIWDAIENKLVLGRNHMGQRALHYHRGQDFFVFATEIKALWSYPHVPRVLSDARARTLGLFVSAQMRQSSGLCWLTTCRGRRNSPARSTWQCRN
jgi:asparagine synthetase B (glutamine-hydrolysing)